MKKNSNTKEAYLLEAMRLFAEKGYEAVSVAEIAQAVGVTTSALYKHYSGKQALFDAIIEKSKVGFAENMAQLRLNFSEEPETRQRILSMTEEGQIEMLQSIFRGVVDNEYPRLFRKLVTVEQFKYPELAELYDEHYIRVQTTAFETLMRIWIQGGVMRPGDPEMMALQYIAPMILMIGVCDREPEKEEEALCMLEDHIRQFNRVYRLQ